MHSATLPAYMSIGIHANHMGMTKFAADDDPGFVSVAGELWRWTKDLESMPPGGGIDSRDSASAPEASAMTGEGNGNRSLGNGPGVVHYGNTYGAGSVVYGNQTFSGIGTLRFGKLNIYFGVVQISANNCIGLGNS